MSLQVPMWLCWLIVGLAGTLLVLAVFGVYTGWL